MASDTNDEGMKTMANVSREMVRITGTRESAVPWWAAFGAPLVGVPLLVGLLALGTPEEPAQAGEPGADAALTSEQVEVAPATQEDRVAQVSEIGVPEYLLRC